MLTRLRTSVQFGGPLSVVDSALADQAEAVVREAVSNAVRHAKASTLTVRVKVDDDLCIEVTDNGAGCPTSSPEAANEPAAAGRAGRRRIHPRERTGRERNSAAMVSTVVAVALPAPNDLGQFAVASVATGRH
ncbi:ATP-binding protein [Mycobacterium tuberculosis]